MPRKKKSEIVVEKIEPMKEDAMNLPVEEKVEENVEVKYGHVSTNFSDVKFVSALTQEELEKYNIN